VRASIALLLALAACSGGGPCKDRSGTYDVTYTPRSGNCGSIPKQTVTLGGDAGATTTACSAKVNVSSDDCAITTDVTCPDGTTSHGAITWDADGAKASGTFQLTAPVCSGTYDVSWLRR